MTPSLGIRHYVGPLSRCLKKIVLVSRRAPVPAQQWSTTDGTNPLSDTTSMNYKLSTRSRIKVGLKLESPGSGEGQHQWLTNQALQGPHKARLFAIRPREYAAGIDTKARGKRYRCEKSKTSEAPGPSFGPLFHRKPIHEKISGSLWSINEYARKERRTMIQIPREYVLIVIRVIPPIGTDGCRSFARKSLGRYYYSMLLAEPSREYGTESISSQVYMAFWGLAVTMKWINCTGRGC